MKGIEQWAVEKGRQLEWERVTLKGMQATPQILFIMYLLHLYPIFHPQLNGIHPPHL